MFWPCCYETYDTGAFRVMFQQVECIKVEEQTIWTGYCGSQHIA